MKLNGRDPEENLDKWILPEDQRILFFLEKVTVIDHGQLGSTEIQRGVRLSKIE